MASRRGNSYISIVLVLFLGVQSNFGSDHWKKAKRFSLCGRVLDLAGNPFFDGIVQLYGPNSSKRDLESRPYVPAKLSKQGTFKYERYLPEGNYWIAVCPDRSTIPLKCTDHVMRIDGKASTTTLKDDCDISLDVLVDRNGLISPKK